MGGDLPDHCLLVSCVKKLPSAEKIDLHNFTILSPANQNHQKMKS